MIYGMDSVHVALGTEWWISIVACTVLARLVLLPANVASFANAARLSQVKPVIEKVVARMNAEASAGNQAAAAAHQRQLQEIWRQHDCHPVKSFLPVLVQAPTFLSFFFALRHMCEHVPSFAEGGALWFTNMAVADPMYISPVLTSATFLLVTELGGPESAANANNPNANTMRWALRGLSLAMVPMTASLPQGVFVYWVTTNILSLTIAQTMKVRAVKAALGIPEAAAAAGATVGAGAKPVSAVLDKFSSTIAGGADAAAATPALYKSRAAAAAAAKKTTRGGSKKKTAVKAKR